jgi:hypothetical protein
MLNVTQIRFALNYMKFHQFYSSNFNKLSNERNKLSSLYQVINRFTSAIKAVVH